MTNERGVSDRTWRTFADFKTHVRERIDPLFLERMLPKGSIVKGVLVETREGNVRFGRQIGSYPILVGIRHSVDEGEFLEVAITEHSSRSVTGFKTPFDLRSYSYSDLTAIPGIGRKRAAKLFRIIGRGEKIPDEMFSDEPWVRKHLVD
jgi:radical SAM superfamily enzyme with C-terminal helix-hairpin-helix motif